MATCQGTISLNKLPVEACTGEQAESPRGGGDLTVPHGTPGAVWVLCSDRAHLRPSRSVLIHIQDVIVQGEQWRLVHVSDDDLEVSGVFEWAQVKKTGVQVTVDPLDVQGVGFLLLIVQLLKHTADCWA